MFLLAFIDEIYTSYLIEQYKDTFYDYSSFCLLSIIPFSYFFFKKKIFLHHQLSIILMFISTIIIIIFYKKDYIQIILSILYFIIFGFEMSVFKYCMEYYFINVYIVCLNQSIAAIILSEVCRITIFSALKFKVFLGSANQSPYFKYFPTGFAI